MSEFVVFLKNRRHLGNVWFLLNCGLSKKGKKIWRSSFRDQNSLLYQAVNMFISAVKSGILTWGGMGIDSLLEPASSGHSKNCCFGTSALPSFFSLRGSCLLETTLHIYCIIIYYRYFCGQWRGLPKVSDQCDLSERIKKSTSELWRKAHSIIMPATYSDEIHKSISPSAG